MYRHILLTVDGSDLSSSAIPHAAELAGSDTEVAVLEVIPTERQLAVEMSGALFEIVEGSSSIEEQLKSAHFVRKQHADSHVSEAVEQLRAAGVKSVQGIVTEGIAANVILDQADQLGSNAIVMATRGHSGLGREVLGSVAEYVLRHAGPRAVVLVGPRARA